MRRRKNIERFICYRCSRLPLLLGKVFLRNLSLRVPFDVFDRSELKYPCRLHAQVPPQIDPCRLWSGARIVKTSSPNHCNVDSRGFNCSLLDLFLKKREDQVTDPIQIERTPPQESARKTRPRGPHKWEQNRPPNPPNFHTFQDRCPPFFC